ncbi:MAG TPA: carbohydrate ABC transporter permease [Chloroflexota bacterium]|nr:carbohydrate ABC transporter permease [Chloroflexota bacterium]
MKTGLRALGYLALTVAVLAVAFPFLWMLDSSVKSQLEATLFPPSVWPQQWHVENYAAAWNAAPFGRYFLNSGIVSALTALILTGTSALAGYAFGTLRFRGRSTVFALFLASLFVPPEVTLIPNFLTINFLRWQNTYAALILPNAVGMFSILLLRQAFRGLPRELAEAASLDGCSRWSYLWRIGLPLVKPMLTVVALLGFLRAWNDFLWPLVVTSDESMRTVQVGLSVFVLDASVQYPLLMAAACFVVAPILVFYLVAQRQFVTSLATTGLKG